MKWAFTKGFAWAGFSASVGLCIFEFITIAQTIEQLAGAPPFFAIVMTLLLVFLLFLACMFYQLATSLD